MSDVLQVTIADVDINIPWSSQYKEILTYQAVPISQAGMRGTNIEDAIKAKLKSRFEFTLAHLIDTLEKLPPGATIVDIGAGNSLVDILINAKFSDKKFKFILVDGDKTYPLTNPSSNNSFYQKDYATYNDWFFLKKIVELNNMDNESFVTKVPNETWSTDSVDLVLSTASWGWHYPVDTYSAKVHAMLKDGGYLYINQALNVDFAVKKLLALFNPIKIIMDKFVPTKSPAENTRSLSLIVDKKINVREFAFMFLGQK
jgi:hypothetical protein